jgi:hypothetical protein
MLSNAKQDWAQHEQFGQRPTLSLAGGVLSDQPEKASPIAQGSLTVK